MLQWVILLKPSNLNIGRDTCRGAAAGGHLAVLQWAREKGCHWGVETCTAAADNGHLAVLRWARHHGCPWDWTMCTAAARGGHLAVLQYARQKPRCLWGSRACSAAAEHGSLSILKWLRQHGCPLDFLTISHAIGSGHLELLKWAHQQQPPCPWGPSVAAGHKLRPSMLVYLWVSAQSTTASTLERQPVCSGSCRCNRDDMCSSLTQSSSTRQDSP